MSLPNAGKSPKVAGGSSPQAYPWAGLFAMRPQARRRLSQGCITLSTSIGSHRAAGTELPSQAGPRPCQTNRRNRSAVFHLAQNTRLTCHHPRRIRPMFHALAGLTVSLISSRGTIWVAPRAYQILFGFGTSCDGRFSYQVC